MSEVILWIIQIRRCCTGGATSSITPPRLRFPVQAVVSLARALGMRTTAEGVETRDQQNAILALGCDEAQGYLFSAPVPVEQVPEILASWMSREPVNEPANKPSKQRTMAA